MAKPGQNQPAKVNDWGTGRDKNNDLYVMIDFVMDDDGSHIIWYGRFNDKKNPEAKKHPWEFTMETLELCGFDSEKSSLDGDFALGSLGGALTVGKEVNLTIEMTTNYEGKEFLSVRYVNPRGALSRRLEGSEITRTESTMLKAIQLRWKSQKKSGGVSGVSKAPTTSAPAGAPNLDEIPF